MDYVRSQALAGPKGSADLHSPPPTMSISPFTSAHRLYVKSLYKRMLKNEMDWVIRYDHFRAHALAVRAQFEANR